MDIIRTIHNLQQKPEHVRKRMLVIYVAVLMVLIVGSWFMIIIRRIHNEPATQKASASQNQADSPFTLVKGTVEASFKNLQTYLKK